jgi:uncharacterized RDD family membrane protein YckC
MSAVLANARFLYVPGGFWRRVLAFVLDGSIILVLQTPVGSLLFGLAVLLPLPSVPGYVKEGLTWVFNIGVAGVYFGYFYSRFGATPGKAVLGLRVLDEATGFYPSTARSLYRELVVKTFSVILTLGIAPLCVGFRRDRRALHDFASRSRVVHVSERRGTHAGRR